MHSAGVLLAVLVATTALSSIIQNVAESAEAGNDEVLRVCADPDNLPFSNRAGEG